MTQQSIIEALFEVFLREREADNDVRERSRNSIRELIQENHLLAQHLLELSTESPTAKVEILGAIESAAELQSVRDYVIDCLLADDEDLGVTAANTAGNIAGLYPAVASAVLSAVRECDARTPPRLYGARVSALRNVAPSEEIVATLISVMTDGPVEAQRAAVSTLARLAPKASPSSKTEPVERPLSSSSETIGRTTSQGIRLASIDVVANVCRQILDEEREDPWIRSTADAVLGLLEPIRDWVSDEQLDRPTGVIERLHEVWRDLTPTEQWGLRLAIGTCLSALGIPITNI